MATNLHAALRYNVIDKCLRDKERTWQWKDLALKCLDEIVSYDANYKLPSRRSIMYDIEHMKSGILGYFAPIDYDRKEGYYYTLPNFSIKNVNLSHHQITDIKQAIYLLKQLTQNDKLAGITSSIEAIEQRLNFATKTKQNQYIYFEESLNAKGQKWLDKIYQHVLNHDTLNITYHPFDKDIESTILSPYFLKEYNNRWYVVGYTHDEERIENLSLDRILDLHKSIAPFNENKRIKHDQYYKNVYGVTVSQNIKADVITLKAEPLLAKYLITKPIHHTQKLIQETKIYSIFTIEVQDNYEIISKLLSFGESIEVVKPKSFRESMKKKVKLMAGRYGR
ncbi:MAG: hypothetical protein RLZZ546_260 [Bacteroidota bacterium]